MKRSLIILVLILAVCLGCIFPGAAETGLEHFKVRYGDPESNRIAITMDDINRPQWAWKTLELCKQYGITMTFFPNGRNIHEEDADHWRNVISSGCEIGSHGNDHSSLKNITDRSMVTFLLGKHQENLDRVLGYHYQIRWYRPPYGHLENPSGSEIPHTRTIKNFGYEHAVLWTVSQTDPGKAYNNVKNGSILLFHAQQADYECLVKLIPKLLEAGYRPVTLSEMFGYDPPEISDELYVYSWDDYKDKK